MKELTEISFVPRTVFSKEETRQLAGLPLDELAAAVTATGDARLRDLAKELGEHLGACVRACAEAFQENLGDALMSVPDGSLTATGGDDCLLLSEDGLHGCLGLNINAAGVGERAHGRAPRLKEWVAETIALVIFDQLATHPRAFLKGATREKVEPVVELSPRGTGTITADSRNLTAALKKLL